MAAQTPTKVIEIHCFLCFSGCSYRSHYLFGNKCIQDKTVHKLNAITGYSTLDSVAAEQSDFQICNKCHTKIHKCFGLVTDLKDAVGRHTVTRYVVCLRLCVNDVCLCDKICHHLKYAGFFFSLGQSKKNWLVVPWTLLVIDFSMQFFGFSSCSWPLLNEAEII